MNLTSKNLSITVGDSIAAYCLAVTTATIAFTFLFLGFSLLQNGYETATTNDFSTKASHLLQQSLLIFIAGWVVAFVTSLIPFCVAIVIARKFSIMRWWYFVGGGFLTAALLCIVHAWVAQDGPPLGPVPDKIPSLAESYLRYCLYYWSSGSLAGLVCWGFLRRSNRATS